MQIVVVIFPECVLPYSMPACCLEYTSSLAFLTTQWSSGIFGGVIGALLSAVAFLWLMRRNVSSTPKQVSGHSSNNNVEDLQELSGRLEQQILQRQRVERQLHESELRYRTIVEDQTEMVLQFTLDGTVLFGNKAFRDRNGLGDEVAKDFNCFSVVHPDDRDRIIRLVASADIDEPFAMDVVRVVRPNGEIDWCEWRGRSLFDADGNHFGFQAVGRVVTELVEARDRIAASELHYRSIIEDLHEMIIRFDAKGTITFANSAYHRDSGRNVDEIIGSSCFERIHPDDVSKARELVTQSSFENPIAQMVVRVVQSDGAIVWQDWNGRAIFDDDKQLLCYQLVGRDITRLRKAQEHLQEKERELAHLARVSALGEMVAGISHELNQPLATISNFSSASALVLEKEILETSDKAKLKDWGQRIHTQTDRITAIIQRLRRFGRPGSDRECFPIVAAVNEALLVTHATVGQSMTIRSMDDREKLPQICGDRIQIEQVLVNLIQNAADAMQEVPQKHRLMCIDAIHQGDFLTVSVTDNGPGVSPEMATRIFESFVTSRDTGMGIGLAISRSIVEAHGGTIRAVTDSNGGRIEFSLPIGDDQS